MANLGQLRRLRHDGVAAWNQWRRENPSVPIDLQRANLKGVSLNGVDLSEADIRGAKFDRADLTGASLARSKAGLQKHWALLLTLWAWIVVMISGYFFGIASSWTTFIYGSSLAEGLVATCFLLGLIFLYVLLLRKGFSAVIGVVAGAVVLSGAVAGVVVFTETAAAAAVAIIVTITFLFAFAGVFAFAVVRAVSGKFAFIIAFAEALLGALGAVGAVTTSGARAFAFEGTVAVVLISINAYIGWLALAGDERYSVIRSFAVAIAALEGTSFRGASLVDADFYEAQLQSTDLRNAIITRSNWFQAKKLDHARCGGTILNVSTIRDLAVTHNGRGKSYIGQVLKGINLRGADLSNANLTEADLSDANLEGATLERANLTKLQALGTEFRQAVLTAACIEAWNIDSATQLDGVICGFIYLLNGQRERRPNSGRFAPGEFAKLFQEILDTVDLIFRDGVDWRAFVQAFQHIQVQNEDTELAIQSIENKGDGVVVVKLHALEDADKAKLHTEFSEVYQIKLQALEAEYKAQLAAKDLEISGYRRENANMLEITKLLAGRPLDVNVSNYSSDLSNREVSVNIINNGNFSNTLTGEVSPSTITIDSAEDIDRTEREIQVVIKCLEQADFIIDRKGKFDLEVLDAPGRLRSYTPMPILFIDEQPNDEDIIKLIEKSENTTTPHQKNAGIIVYIKALDNALFRMKMTEVRLRNYFITIPIPFAALEKALIEDTSSPLQGAVSKALLAEYTDRYLPGANLFDDRNAIGDTFTFFGRDKVLHRLQEELTRPQGLGIFGLRKSGKTSLLIQLGFAMRRHPIVHIDLQPYGGRLRYGAELFNQILHQLFNLAKDRDAFSNSNQELEVFDHDQPAAEVATSFSEHLSTLTEILVEDGYEMPILIFLDEIERIFPTETDSVERIEEFNALFGVLRALSQKQRKISLLVVDVHPDCNRINKWEQSGAPTNPVFNFFKEFFLSPFSEEETAEMIVSIGKLMELSFDKQVISSIHQASGGHPFLSRQMANMISNKISKDGNKKIEWLPARRYIDKPFSHSGILKDYFRFNVWCDLQKRNFNSAIAVLKAISCSEILNRVSVEEKVLFAYLQQEDFTESQCLDALLWLGKVGLVSHEELQNRSIYKMQASLFSRWIRMQMKEDEIQQWKIQ